MSTSILDRLIKNEGRGKVYYGLHCYPGAAEYREPGKEMFRVFLNEDTLRSMDASFQGKPVFVLHVNDVEQDLETLRGEADGWVIRSFYNAADGKHWCQFIAVTERAIRAIEEQGMKLSNAYILRDASGGGQWNGIDFQKQVTAAEYEHLAIVPNPRYEESIILTPDEFKTYNEEKTSELNRLTNEKESPVLHIFKKNKLENDKSKELEGLVVVLPKTNIEIGLLSLINAMDEHKEKEMKDAKEPPMCNGDHHVMVGDEKMTVNELLVKHKAMCDEMNSMKNDEESEEAEGEEHEEGTEKEERAMNAQAEADAAAAAVAVAKAKKADGKAKADALRNQKPIAEPEVEEVHIDTPYQQLARGASRYG